MNSTDATDPILWQGFPKYNDNCILIGKWGEEYETYMGMQNFAPPEGEMRIPIHLLSRDEDYFAREHDRKFANPENPVIHVPWFDANAYCNWLMRHWGELLESKVTGQLNPRLIRLPLETEWVIAAGGDTPPYRFPWDPPGRATKDIKEITLRANVLESDIGHTTPVNAYVRGASPYGVMDMAGNVYEWQANFRKMTSNAMATRGGAWIEKAYPWASVGGPSESDPDDNVSTYIGFRVLIINNE